MLTRPVGWWDTAQYVTPDPESLKRAEASAERELEAQSRVIRHARVCRAEFWRMVDARRAQQEAR